MPSMDIVSRLDMQELDNAVNNVIKEVSTRYDFRGSRTTIELNKTDKKIHIITADEMKMRAIKDLLISHCVRRGVSPKCLDFKNIEPTSNNMIKMDVAAKEGIEKEMAQRIVKLIKDTKLKVQASIQDIQVRVEGKKIDDLQSIIQLLNAQNFEIPFQYVNMKR